MCYDELRELMNMKDYYEKSIQMIKSLNTNLTKEQYNKLAKKYNLLCSESLEYISRKNFDELILENVA